MRHRELAPCWPTERQELLLRAALHPPQRAGDAFAEWLNETDLQEIDGASWRLLPLVYRNLRRGGITTSSDTMLWHAYVEASGRNQMLFRTLELVLGHLNDAGVPTLVLKGAALTQLHYRDCGARPMNDVDVLVPLDLAGRALEVLRAEGWDFMLPGTDRPVDELRRLRHSVPLRRGDDELDLHWYALLACIGSDIETELWDASVEMQVRGQHTRGLAPADQLLHAFAHGLRYDPLPPLRWIADANVVITSTGEELDWDRLIRLSRRYRLAAWTSAAIEYLDGLVPFLVPPHALGAARSLPIPRRERREFENAIRHSHWLLDWWRRYRRREPDQGTLQAAVGFAGELRVLYDVDHVWQVPEQVVRGMYQRWRDPNGAGDERTA